MSCCQHVGSGDMTSFPPNSETDHLYVTSPSTPPLRHEACHLYTEPEAFMLKANFDMQVGNRRRTMPSSGKRHSD
jgi:hypothetical protein